MDYQIISFQSCHFWLFLEITSNLLEYSKFETQVG